MIRYWGTSPKLGSCQGECPYPCVYVSFLGGGDDGVVDDAPQDTILLLELIDLLLEVHTFLAELACYG